jgi:hypothetical protein
MKQTRLRPSAIARFAGTGLAATLAISPAFAQDGSIEALREQLRQLQMRIDQLERDRQADRQAQAKAPPPAPANVVTKGDTPGSFKLPGSDTSVQIGGYLKFDAIYDRNQDLGDSLYVEGLNVGDDRNKGSVRFHARESRLFIKTSTPNAYGGLRTHLEGDFFGGGGNEVTSNSRGFRLRHAYGELGRFLAGQTWSNFMQFVAYPSTVDFDGPVGVPFVRQAQFRYTMPLGQGALSFSAENPEATGFAGARDSAPDLTARYSLSAGNVGLEAGVLLRRLAYDDGGNDDTATGHGLMLAGSVGLGAATKLMAGAVWGDGIGRYIYDASGAADGSSGIGEAYINSSGKLKTIRVHGFNVAASHQWTEKLSSVLSYGQVRGDRPGDLFPTSTDKLESIHFANFYKVIDPVTLGFEIARAEKRVQNGDSAHDTRVQASAKYDF